ncbi:MAG: AraC family transcriptional regulator, partial [Planctomycetota bacterium]
MQKRYYSNVRRKLDPIELPAEFPLKHSEYHHPDRPIKLLHRHNCLEIGYCHTGSGIFVVEDKVMPYKTGDICVINDREMHIARSATGTFSDWTFIQFDPASLTPCPTALPETYDISRLGGPEFINIASGDSHPDVRDAVVLMIDELKQQREGYKDAVRGLALALMAKLRRLEKPLASPSALTCGLSRIAPALHDLVRSFAEPLRMDDLASACHVCPAQFRRLFRAATGQTPLQYLNRLRIQMAASLLTSTDKSVQEISESVGYSTLSSFNRQFQAMMNQCPRD